MTLPVLELLEKTTKDPVEGIYFPGGKTFFDAFIDASDDGFRFFYFFATAGGDIDEERPPVIGIELSGDQTGFFKPIHKACDGRIVDADGLTELRHDPAVPFLQQKQEGGLRGGDLHPFFREKIVQVSPQGMLRHRNQVD